MDKNEYKGNKSFYTFAYRRTKNIFVLL